MSLDAAGADSKDDHHVRAADQNGPLEEISSVYLNEVKLVDLILSFWMTLAVEPDRRC